MNKALDGSSPLYLEYSNHLSMATAFYTQLLTRLEEHYRLPVTSVGATQLHGNCIAHTCTLCANSGSWVSLLGAGLV